MSWEHQPTVMHRAWAFDPAVFFRWLDEWAVREGKLRPDLLRELARNVVEGASPTALDALEWMRFDEEWLDEPGPDESRADECFAVALVRHLRPAPSLNNRVPTGHVVLRSTLPLAGWPEDDVRHLVQGRPLGTLASAFGGARFAADFGRLWYERGGWTDTGTAKELLSRLTTTGQFFLSPPKEAVEWATEYAGWVSRSPAGMLEDVYDDAQEMLRTALEREEALFLVLD